jgi:NarL family two-component system sensor histidine kinase LiaS
MKRSAVLPHPFRHLRWRLTLSYTLVTVAALVVVELALLSLLLILINSELLNEEFVKTIRDGYVPQASSFLESEPPDIDGLDIWLQAQVNDSVATNEGGRRITQGLSINFDQDYQIVVVDEVGNLLAQAVEGYSPSTLGAPFETSAFPQLAPLLSSALAGSDSSDLLYTRTSDGTLAMAFPIISQQGHPLGVFAISLHIPAFNLRTLGSIMMLILISLIPITLAAGVIGTVFGFWTARGLTNRIESLSGTANAWSHGDFSVMAGDPSADELGQLSRRLNLMAEQLQNLLHTRQELAGIEERNRLARELHDSVKQQAFAISMQVGAAQALLPGDVAGAQRHLVEAEALARQAQEELAGLIEELRPLALGEDGFAESLKEYVSEWSRRTGIDVQMRTLGERPLPAGLEPALFRVAQEALSNVARHSQARHVEVDLTRQGEDLLLTISDDGCGFATAGQNVRGYGLQSMQERVEALGGQLLVRSAPQQGTQIQARFSGLTGDPGHDPVLMI